MSINNRLAQLFWECTLRCNLKCIHCGSDCRSSASLKDMPFEDIEPVLGSIASRYDAGKIVVVTTGGEPLVRDDIVECGRRISNKGFIWGMVSNGMLLDKSKLKDLKSAGLKTIAISLDGFEAEHNWIRGSQLCFDKASDAIRALSSSGGIVWDVITCVNQRNITCLDSFKEYLIRLGVKKWRVFTIVPMGRAAGNNELQLDGGQLKQLMEFIVRVKAEGRIKIDFSCEGYLGEYEMKARYYPFYCNAGTRVASILADGTISGCLSIRSSYSQGNIYRGDDFIDVWENRFEQYRNKEWMKVGECAECKVWDCCHGGAFHLRDDNGSMLRCNYLELNT